MKHLLKASRHSLSFKLGLSIIIFIVVIFLLSVGLLFVRSRQLVRQEAIERGAKSVDKMALQISDYLNEVEAATENMEWLVRRYPTPDSLMSFSRRIVELNPNVYGCTITLEPDFFPESGGNFSVQSNRQNKTVVSACKRGDSYYRKTSYKSARMLRRSTWVEPFENDQADIPNIDGMIASYSMPVIDSQGRLMGVISTDLSLTWLSEVFAEEKPYPHSYSIMLGKNGNYFVHPDTTKLVNHTINEGIGRGDKEDFRVLGHEMLAGKDDYMKININDEDCYVFYQPLQKTGWSIAMICPESDILGSYNRLGEIIFAVIVVGLILIFLFSIRSVSQFIDPLNLLVAQTEYIASGHFNEYLPRTKRSDLIGQLQNSFVTMQESLNEQINQLHKAKAEAEERNRELLTANQLAHESIEKKQAFIQDVSHQIRTPLNIIQGFSMVLRDTEDALPLNEKNSITDTMYQNAGMLRRTVHMLLDASWLQTNQPLALEDVVLCNNMARQAVEDLKERAPYHVVVTFETSVPDSLQIHTDSDHMYRIICELIHNAKKYAGDSPVCLKVERTSERVLFVVEDQGPGIPERQREQVFKYFIKLDTFSEGLGLGLNTSRSYAHKMGGELTLDDSYQQGCRFVLSLPIK